MWREFNWAGFYVNDVGNPPPVTARIAARVGGYVGVKLSRRWLLAAWLACWAGAQIAIPTRAAAQTTRAAAGPATDTPLWRATHGPLVAIARAGARLVAVGDRGVVLLSDDQGGSWTEVASGSAVLLTALAFISPQEGWAVGQDSTILHTRDAGAHWTIQLSKPKADQALFSVAYLGPGTGGAHLIATGAYALALETQDGGRHWDSVKLPAMDDDYHLNCALGLEGGAGLVITGEAGHAFIRRDGVWAAMKLPYDGSQFGCLAGRGGAIYSFGLRGSLFVAHPGPPNPASPPPASLPPAPLALQWTRIPTGEQRSLFGGTALADGTFVLVGGNGLVLHVDPASGTSRIVPAPTSDTLSGVAPAADGAWVLVGNDGVHLLDPRAAAPEVTQ
jgi:photosystem II stability/assembly factor-like uncharacterized protein